MTILVGLQLAQLPHLGSDLAFFERVGARGVVANNTRFLIFLILPGARARPNGVA